MLVRDIGHRHQFMCDSKRFSLTECAARLSVPERGSCQAHLRAGHSCVLQRNSAFLFGGVQNTRPSQHVFSTFNLRSRHWSYPETLDCPPTRDGHGCAILNSKVLIFGGHNFGVNYNDLHEFHSYSSTWTEINTTGTLIPSARSPGLFVPIGQSEILLLGGFQTQTQTILKDAFLLSRSQWVPLQPTPNSLPLETFGYKGAVCGNRIFFYGGETSQENFPTGLYQVTVCQTKRTFTVKLVEEKNDLCPPGRKGHCMLAINEDYFVLFGGFTKDKENRIFQRDFWIRDCQTERWVRVEPTNGPLPALCDFSAIFFDHLIFVIGGLQGTNMNYNDQLLEIQFFPDLLNRNQVCSNCVVKKAQPKKESISSVWTSIEFTQSLALKIQHPFSAFGLLHDCAFEHSATHVSIQMKRFQNEEAYILAQFNGSSYLKGAKSEESWLSVALGGLRLGRTVLAISRTEEFIDIRMVSSNSKILPEDPGVFSCYKSCQQLKTGRFPCYTDWTHFNYINNNLKVYQNQTAVQISLSHYGDPRKTDKETTVPVLNNTIFIIELHQNSFEPDSPLELDSQEADIKLERYSSRMDFLKEAGYAVTSDIQISLVEYLRRVRLNNKTLKCKVNGGQWLSGINYQTEIQAIKGLKSKGHQSGLPSDGSNKAKQGNSHHVDSHHASHNSSNSNQLLIFACSTKVPTTHHSQGVLLYSDQRLINRFPHPLGELFTRAFYKTLYRRKTDSNEQSEGSYPLHNHFGLICLSRREAPTDLAKTQFRKTSRFAAARRVLMDRVGFGLKGWEDIQ